MEQTQNFAPLYLPALRCRMGDWFYYVTALQLQEVAERVKPAEELHQNKSLNELIQRELTDRAKKISDYLVNQDQRFFNAIIIAVYEGKPDWLNIELFSTDYLSTENISAEATERINDTLGLLRLTGAEKLFALDGQHRVEGIKQAVKRKADLKDDEVSVIFVGHENSPKGLVRTRRLFSTLNRYAKPVSKGEIVALDEDDPIAVVTRRLLDEHSLLNGGRVSASKQANMPTSDKRSFTNILTIYDVNNTIITGRKPEWSSRKLGSRKIDDINVNDIFLECKQFFDALAATFDEVRQVQESAPESESVAEFRHDKGGHLLFRPVGLMAFATAIRALLDQGRTFEEAFQRLAKLSYELNSPEWHNLLWNPADNTMLYRKDNQKLAAGMMLYLSGTTQDVQSLLRDYRKVLGDPEAELPPVPNS